MKEEEDFDGLEMCLLIDNTVAEGCGYTSSSTSKRLHILIFHL